VTRWLRAAAGCALVLAAREAPAQAAPEVFGWVRDHAHRFGPLDSTATSLAPLAERLAGTRLIGVGESIHFQHEFLEFRAALLRELVLRRQVTAVALESGFPEAIDLDRYVTGRVDRVDWSAVLAYRFGAFAEVQSAFEWLRRWNREPGHRPVHVYGIDLPGSAGSMVPALRWLTGYLERVDPATAARVRTDLIPAAARVEGPFWQPAARRYDSLPAPARDSLKRNVASLLATVRARRAAYLKRADRSEYEWALRMAIVCEQQATFLRLKPYHPTNPRDVAMADNTRWVLDHEGPNGRVLLWAHNAHVSKAAIEGPASPAKTPVPSMGGLFHRALGPAYQSIGFTYARGASDSLPDPLSLDATMAAADSVPYWIATGDGPAPAAMERWLDAPHLIQFQGVGYLRIAPRRAYDYLVFFPRISAAQSH
jgi:erythromycin esterase